MNHVTCIDPWIIAQLGRFSVISAAENKNFPIMGSICKVLNALIIERSKDKDAMDRIVHSIIDRQNSIEQSNDDLDPLVIFPEGQTSNGTHILSFKRGAFIGEKRVRPLFIKHNYNATCSLAFDVIDIIPVLILQICSL